MIDPPEIGTFNERLAAVVHLTIPRERIEKEMEPAINEVLSALSAQNLSPVGPLFAHHLTQDNAVFDFEVGFPVSCEIEPTGRVKNSVLPAGDAVYTSYVGSYDGLFAAWSEFDRWIRSEGALGPDLERGDTLWEVYSIGPESTSDSAQWRTELFQSLRRKGG